MAGQGSNYVRAIIKMVASNDGNGKCKQINCQFK